MVDFDQDGDIDLYLLNHSIHSPSSFDKAEKRQVRDAMAGDILFRNDDGKFVDISEEAGIYGGSMGFGLGIAISDLNTDGYPDIYVSNDFHENDYLYLNKGDGTFREVIKETTSQNSTFSMGCDIADVNNDNRPDIFTLDMRPEQEEILKQSGGIDHHNLYFFKLDYDYHFQFPRNMLHLNRGIMDSLPRFSEVANAVKDGVETGKAAQLQSTDWSWAPLMADFDNDSYTDIFIANGIWKRPNDLDYLKFVSAQEVKRSATDLEIIEKMPDGQVANYVFKNVTGTTDSTFPKYSDKSAEWGLDLKGCSNGAAYADLDNDGDLDLVVNNLNEAVAVYKNTTDRRLGENNYLNIRIKGNEKNPFGIGAKVKVGAAPLKELYPVRGWQSSMDYTLHFAGLIGDNLTVVIELEGKELVLNNVKSRQILEVDFSKAQTKKLAPQSTNTPIFKDISAESGLDFLHKENKFIDFNIQPLQPWQTSKEGPALAVGDVDKNGFQDIYIGGAKSQAGGLYLQKNKHRFERQMVPLFEDHKMQEDMAATFFDADGDGDLDLYVASGGGEARSFSTILMDRLYFNDGKGHFSEKENALPLMRNNGSCIVTADFNGDEFPDVFIGSHAISTNYGIAPESVVLINDGKGVFKKDEQFAERYGTMGMVKDATFLAKEKQLVVVGEWMEPVFF